MSFENVVFTTKQNGASEIIDQRYIMESPNDFSITQEIEKLLLDEVLLNKEQIKCRKIAKNFTIEKNAKKTLQLIEKVLKYETTYWASIENLFSSFKVFDNINKRQYNYINKLQEVSNV